jgi:hypothetical protein
MGFLDISSGIGSSISIQSEQFDLQKDWRFAKLKDS